MKVKVGDYVAGECGEGRIIAMTEQWCIYRDKNLEPGDDEVAEPWRVIVVPATHGEVVSSVTEMDVPRDTEEGN